ncbi:MAG: glycosyltransferase family 2 protein [bacterium]|nr:glycosyltransferase family 2 protein [bacterium]
MKLSVIIPAYNEERRLPKTLGEIDVYLKRQTFDYEIIVVSDGSKDGTAAVVRGLASVIQNLRLIDNKENHGKGYVVRQGLLGAGGDYRLFTDADNSTAISEIEKMWPELEKGIEIVIGSRDIKGAIIEPPQPFYRVMLGNIFNLIVQAILGLWGIWDTQCGFKIMSASACQKILPKCRIDRWAFDPEILVLAKKMGYKIGQTPVRWANDPESKVKFKGMVRMLLEVLQIRWNMIRGRY